MESRAVDDYLKTMYEVEQEHGRTATTVLAERLGVTPASATGMVKRLAEMDLVKHEPYHGVALTEAGGEAGAGVVRHHRLIELFLTETLGVPWDRVHEEAHRIEHVLSEDLEERMDVLLGRPTKDPHGSPIPTRDGKVERPMSTRLAELKAGQTAVVTEVRDEDAALLRYLGSLGLYPEAEVEMLAVAPFDGPLTVRVGGRSKRWDRPRRARFL